MAARVATAAVAATDVNRGHSVAQDNVTAAAAVPVNRGFRAGSAAASGVKAFALVQCWESLRTMIDGLRRTGPAAAGREAGLELGEMGSRERDKRTGRKRREKR
jgi:hypothetical protein